MKDRQIISVSDDFWNKYEKLSDLDKYKYLKTNLSDFNRFLGNKKLYEESFYSMLVKYFDNIFKYIKDRSLEELLENKKVVFVNPVYQKSNIDYRNFLKKKPFCYELWMISDSQKVSELDGNNWDVSPWYTNAEIPYSKKCEGLTKIKVFLNKPLKVSLDG